MIPIISSNVKNIVSRRLSDQLRINRETIAIKKSKNNFVERNRLIEKCVGASIVLIDLAKEIVSLECIEECADLPLPEKMTPVNRMSAPLVNPPISHQAPPSLL